MRPCLHLSRTMALMVLVYVLQIGVEHIAGFTIHVGHPSHDLHKVVTNSGFNSCMQVRVTHVSSTPLDGCSKNLTSIAS